MKGLVALTIFLPAVFCSYKAATQDSASRFSVLLSPALFIPVSVAVQGGVQYKIAERWSILAEAALPIFRSKNNEYENINYRRTGLTIKYRPGKMKMMKGYLALQTNYLTRTFTDKDEAIFHRKDGDFVYSDAIIRSPVLSSAFAIGFEGPEAKRFFADAFFGMGVRILFNQYESKSRRPTGLQRTPDSFPILPEEGWRFDYTLTRFHVAAGIRFGVRL